MIQVCRGIPKGKKLVIAGCLPLINLGRLQKEVKFDAVAGPAAGEQIVGLVKCVLRGEKIFALKGSLYSKPSLTLPRVQHSPVVSIVPISYGCLGSCAYCCTVFARGHLRSYAARDVVERVREDLGRGFREFWLTSQDAGAYGRDICTNLAELLDSLCALSRDFRVRIGMMTPSMVIDILDELVEALRDKRIFKFVHLPVQSGDDQILQRMQRSYSVDDFKRVVKTFRARFPELTLATDVICGFPGEEKEAFERTLRLIEDVKPDVVNVSKFFARPKTVAAKMHSYFVSPSDIKRRSSVAGILAKRVAYERNKHWAGWRGEILIDEIGKAPGSWVGRNLAYKPVVVKSAQNLLGEALNARISNAFPTYLEGEIVE
jgi:MiaB-like tRNA modifying enzyme